MHWKRILPSAAVLLAAAVLFHAADNPKLPPPYATPSSKNGPHVIPQPEGAKLSVPSGFQMEMWEGGFVRPRYMFLGPCNEVILAEAARRPQAAEYVQLNSVLK